MSVRRYPSSAAFKDALEQRLKSGSSGSANLQRNRQLLVFERYLARAANVLGDAMILKGGLCLELRLHRARTTRDVDLRVSASPLDILSKLQTAAHLDLGDYLTFEIEPDELHPTIENEGVQYEGLRFRAECQLAGKLYGQRFGVDVAFGDPMFGETQSITTPNSLVFLGVPPPTLNLYPVETHIAEKLHAYTMPRSRPNSRVKDLPDLALLASVGPLAATALRAALEQTFSFRATHALPTSFPEPAQSWEAPYSTMASLNALAWPTLINVTNAVKTFLDAVLQPDPKGTWHPESWSWRHSTE